MTSAMPSTAAASCNSRVRTPARSPSGTSAGSLTDPRSPREAHINTTRAPASDRRASVPPHASDSSSGCAKMARTVRPAKDRSAKAFPPSLGCEASELRRAGALRSTMRLHEFPVHVDVLVYHACDAEARHSAVVDPLPVEIEHAAQIVHHLLEVLEHQARDAVVHHFADGAAIE